MALTVHDLRSAIEANAKVNIGWWGSAKDCDGMRFVPMVVANYLCDLAPGHEGAIHQYVWQMAFAERRSVAALALRNLASLLDGTVELPHEEF